MKQDDARSCQEEEQAPVKAFVPERATNLTMNGQTVDLNPVLLFGALLAELTEANHIYFMTSGKRSFNKMERSDFIRVRIARNRSNTKQWHTVANLSCIR